MRLPEEPDIPDSGATPGAQPSVSAEPLPQTAQVIEALLFAAEQPIGAERLAELAETDVATVRKVVEELNQCYTETGRTFRISRVAQGYQLYTLPQFAEWVRRLYHHQQIQRLSSAALEVLAIIAYHQPVTKPEIERLRGVDCSAPLMTLLERGLIVTAGRAHRPGNPFLYRTTKEFLRYFGLESLDDLPTLDELSTFLAGREPESG
ncbi:MAG: SMC-Scp complex subunit ScpB [candidate division WOR-3 bacterium]